MPVLQFALLGATAAMIVGVAVSIASRRVGEREAIVLARSEALVKGQAIVEPLLSDAILTSDETAIGSVDAMVRAEVLDATLVRVKVWSAEGVILYSDEAELVGARYDLGEDERESIANATAEAEVSDLGRPENRFERSYGKLLEVYLPLHTPNGTPVLFEAYFRYETVEEAGQDIWRSFAPITLGSLVVLELIQIPLAWSLAQRLRRRQLEREELLGQAIEASSRERRRIAQDLHDGVVQDLAGVSFSLGAARRRGAPVDPAALEPAADVVRRSLEALRTLMIDIYPPDLAQEGLASALADLVTRARAAGLETELDVDGLDDPVPVAAAGLAYRVAQEALRNTIAHAEASRVTVQASSRGSAVSVRVVDDGSGFDVDRDRPTGAGHLGLNALIALCAEAGADLRITSAPGSGTTVQLDVDPGSPSKRARGRRR